MATGAVRIGNRNPATLGLPPIRWLTGLLVAGLFAINALFYVAHPVPGYEWLAWLDLAVGLSFPFAIWAGSISWIEIDAERIVVRRPSRAQVISMQDVVGVDAHRHWQSSLVRGKPPAYWLSIRRTSRRPVRLDYIDPAAGDRLLVTLYQLKKPILVYAWQ